METAVSAQCRAEQTRIDPRPSHPRLRPRCKFQQPQ